MRPTPYRVVKADKFKAPWWAQRMAYRALRDHMFCVGVCGRQGGKSAFGAWVLLRRAALAPGGESLLLVPTFKMADQGAQSRISELIEVLPGYIWRDQKKYYELWNGHKVWVRSCDDPDSVRGPSVTTTLWIDEGAMVNQEGYQNALATLVTADNPRVLITTTPKGKASWMFRLWTSEDPEIDMARFTFRSQDSPVANPAILKQLGASMTADARAQELHAVFLDPGSLPFHPDDVERLISTPCGQIRGKQLSLGIDLAKESDWTVLTLMNEFGESWILDRWRHQKWPQTEARILRYAREHRAICVVDEGHGGGYGGVMADYLERELSAKRVLRVRTGMVKAKSSLIEALIQDVENGRLRLEAGLYKEQVRREFEWFSAVRKVVRGVEMITYEAPPGEDEHDDCVVSVALANHGRIFGWTRPDPLEGDHSGFYGEVERVSEDIGIAGFGGIPA